MFNVNNKDTKAKAMVSFWFFIVNFEHISHLVLVFLLLTLKMKLPGGVRIIFFTSLM